MHANLIVAYLLRQNKFIFASLFTLILLFCLQRTFLPDIDSSIPSLYDPSIAQAHVSSALPLSSLGSTTAANSTLGFGTILAVSARTSKRRAGLLWAANLTGIEIVIPEQPVWTDEDLEAFRKEEESRIDKGSAMAWLGHLNALKWFLETGHETALVMEDDADWDIALRSEQILLAAESLRALLPSTDEKAEQETTGPFTWSSPHRKPLLGDKNTDPHHWANTSKWELLHLGHGVEHIDPDLFHRIHSHPYKIYPDHTVPPQSSLDRTSTLLYQLALPEKHRLWHRSYWPLGSYAYAVTRASAHRLLSTYGTETAVAFDVALLEACRDRDWLCYTAEPGLINEFRLPSEIGNVNVGGKIEDQSPGELDENMGRTVNIRCGVRQPGFWVDESDQEGRRAMVERVLDGLCPVKVEAET